MTCDRSVVLSTNKTDAKIYISNKNITVVKGLGVMVFNATLNNISVISWRFMVVKYVLLIIDDLIS